MVCLAACQTVGTGGALTVRLEGFPAFAVEQRTPVWCWAACAEMISSYGGKREAQEAIAARIHGCGEDGSPKVALASRHEVYRALCPDAPATCFEAVWQGLEASGAKALDAWLQGGGCELDLCPGEALRGLDDLLPAKRVPIDALRQNQPAVAGLRERSEDREGHVYVLIGARYRPVAEARYRPATEWLRSLPIQPPDGIVGRLEPPRHTVESVELVDPWRADDPGTPGNEMLVTLPFSEFERRVDFVTTRADAHEILTRWSKLATVEAR
jgi:hypothetical protein